LWRHRKCATSRLFSNFITMKIYSKGCVLFLILFLMTPVLSVNAAETGLQKGFKNPPDSAKPRTW